MATVATNRSVCQYVHMYTNAKTIKAFRAKNYTVIGALKTNRIIYPEGNRVSISEGV